MNIVSTKIHKFRMKSLINKFIAATMLIGGIGVIGGCAISNEGRVDFRKTSVKQGFQEGGTLDYTATRTTTQMLPLEWKNYTVSKRRMFNKGDSISMHLRTAYIKDFAEMANPLKVFTRGGITPNGEIAIVANAFEEGEGKSKELDFKSNEAGRLVFYCDDVRKGQALNFTNMPIYGPIEYKGGPVALRISIFELDVVSEQAKALIGVVAKLGSTAYPPAAPILGALNKIGKGLAGGKQNDTEFNYWLVFDPSEGSHDLNHFVLEVGNYVFVRSEDRAQEIPWDNLLLDENKQILYRKDTNVPYEDNTYIVVEIQKDVSSLQIDLSQSTYSELLTYLQTKDSKGAGMIAKLSDVQSDIKDALLPRTQKKNFNLAKDLLAKIANLKEPREEEERKYTIGKLVAMISDSLQKPADNKIESAPDRPLSMSQVDYLFTRLRGLAPTLVIGNDTFVNKNIEAITKDILDGLKQ